MKCLLITSYFPPTIGGSAKVYGNLFKYGQNKVSVLTARFNCTDGKEILPKLAGRKNIYSVKYLRAPSIQCRNTLHTIWVLFAHDLPTQIIALFSAFKVIKRGNFDVVCIGELQELGWLGFLLRKITPIKVIIFVHGEELTTKTSSRFFGKHGRFYLKMADGIVSVSQYTKNTITKMFGIPEEKIQLISNGIDIDDYRPVSTSSSITKKYKQPGKTLIFCIGRLIERKGFDKAIEAMNIVRTKHPDIHLVIAGEGDMQHQLENQIHNLGLRSVVALIGRLSHDDLVSFYKDCDIFLMPNRELPNGDTEGFGLVFLEAGAFRKPVIGGNAGGAVDAILHEKTGLLVDGNSAPDIASAILRLMENESLRKQMGEAGYHWALQNDVKNKANDFIDYCEYISTTQE